jgi:hypothetical protein
MSGRFPCDRLSIPCGPPGWCMGLVAAQVAPVPRLQKCYLPILRPGHIRIPGVTLRHFERRALMLFHATNPEPRDN